MTHFSDESEHISMNDPRNGSNWDHYLEAFETYISFCDVFFSDDPRYAGEDKSHSGAEPQEIKVSEENKLDAIDGFLSLYCDLLGFSDEIVGRGFDALPDYYGAALAAAKQSPSVQVYLLSDSCIAFAPLEEIDSFIKFISTMYGRWIADSLLPQCYIGYGSFAERRPFQEITPPNFFGTQITGTALVDAVNVQKQRNKPLGARILVSKIALEKLPEDLKVAIDQNGNAEVFPLESKLSCLQDSIYYMLCLRTQECGTRPFSHYVWSAASRIRIGGNWVFKVAESLVRPKWDDDRSFDEALASIKEVLEGYRAL